MAFKRMEARRQDKRILNAKAAIEERNRLRRWAAVFGTDDGLLVLDELLDRCGSLDSIWDSSARIHYNSGRQDLGNEIVADILKADDAIYHRLVDKWVHDAAIREAARLSGEGE
jgi:hypothetical protein